MDRIEFLKTASSAAVLLCLGISLESCSKDDDKKDLASNPFSFTITESPFNALENVGGWLLHPEQDVLLVNVGGNIRAFTSVCTHTGCSRQWSFPSGNFRCGCHGSTFNTNGNVVSGPANGSLAEFKVERSGDTVTIS